MLLAEQIQQRVQELPEPLQAEVLDFTQYLLSKFERESAEAEDHDWSDLSLQMAMRDMEDEDGPEYTLDDLKVSFGQ